MIRKTLAAASVAALVAVPAAAQAAPGDLDPTFGTAGVVLDRHAFFANDVLALSDGSVVLATDAWSLVKLRPDGTRDPAFGAGGVVQVADPGGATGALRHLALDDQGRILAASSDFVARVLPDGTPDPAWGGGAPVDVSFGDFADDTVVSITAVPGGGVAVAGYGVDGAGDPTAGVARLTATGTYDPAFSGDGQAQVGIDGVSTRFADLIPDGFGGLYLVGSADTDAYLAHLRGDGAGDPFFGTGGRVRAHLGAADDLARPQALVLTPDRRLVLAGLWSGDGTGLVGSFRADEGTPAPGLTSLDLDPETFNELTDVALSRDGDVLVGGTIGVTGDRDAAVARIHADGTLDVDFGTGGIVRHDTPRGGAIIRALARDSYGAITAVGTAQDTILAMRITDRGFTPRPTTGGETTDPPAGGGATGGGGAAVTPATTTVPDAPTQDAPSQDAPPPVVVTPDVPRPSRPAAWFDRVRSALRLTGQADQGAARVQVAVQRRSGRRCAALTSTRRARLGTPTACARLRVRWLTATLTPRTGRTTAWTLRFGARPAPGRYTATVRALDAQGQAGKTARVTFRVR